MPLVDTGFQKGIIEEGVWVKLESRLKGYPPRPKVALTKRGYLPMVGTEDFRLKESKVLYKQLK